jgi:hypothetical protein
MLNYAQYTKSRLFDGFSASQSRVNTMVYTMVCIYHDIYHAMVPSWSGGFCEGQRLTREFGGFCWSGRLYEVILRTVGFRTNIIKRKSTHKSLK